MVADSTLALVARTLYAIHNPEFEDDGQPLDQMRRLDELNRNLGMPFESVKMAEAAARILSE